MSASRRSKGDAGSCRVGYPSSVASHHPDVGRLGEGGASGPETSSPIRVVRTPTISIGPTSGCPGSDVPRRVPLARWLREVPSLVGDGGGAPPDVVMPIVIDDVAFEIELSVTTGGVSGDRWWAKCPSCGARRRDLYLDHDDQLGCRGCLGLLYKSQSLSRPHRLLRRARRLRDRVAGGPDLVSPFPSRPPRMRLSRYSALRADYEATLAEAINLISDPRR